MDPIILSQKVKKWIVATKYLKEHAAEMSVQENTALEFLFESWRTCSFSSDLANDAKTMIKILVDSDVLHSSNRDIITYSKEVRATADLMYTRNAATYEEMRKALREGFKEAKPKTPVPSKPREPQKPIIKTTGPALDIVKVLFADRDINGNERERSLSLSRRSRYIHPVIHYRRNRNCGQVTIGYKLYNSDGTLFASANSTTGFTGQSTFNPLNSGEIILSGWGSADGGTYPPGKYKVEIYEDKQLLTTVLFEIRSDRDFSDVEFTITGVTFENIDYDGNILQKIENNRFPVTARYISPVIHYRSNGLQITELAYRYFSPSGKLLTSSCSGFSYGQQYTVKGDVFLHSDKTSFMMIGYGNNDGNFYSSTGTYRVEILRKGQVIAKSEFYIGNRPIFKPKPVYTPTPSYKPVTKKKSFGIGKICLIVFLILLAAGLGYWYYDYSRTEASASIMYLLEDYNAFDKNNKSVYLHAGECIKRYKVENNNAQIKTEAGNKVWIPNSVLIPPGIENILNEAAGGNPEIKDSAFKKALYNYIIAKAEEGYANWKIPTGYPHLSPKPIIIKDDIEGTSENVIAFIIGNGAEFRQVIYVGATLDSDKKIASGQWMTKITYNKWTKKYDVTYASDSKICSSKQTKPTEKSPFIITDIKLVSTNKNGVLISNSINKYTQYASPKITYKALYGSVTRRFTIKVFTPEGELLHNSSSPTDATYSDSFTPSYTSSTQTLAGWGTPDGNFYTRPGFRFEIWFNRQLLAVVTS